MKRLFQLTFVLLLCGVVKAQPITLVENGKSAYTIVMPQKATIIEIQAAKVIQDYLYRMTGVLLPTGFDNDKEKVYEILIGKVNRPQSGDIAYETFTGMDY